MLQGIIIDLLVSTGAVRINCAMPGLGIVIMDIVSSTNQHSVAMAGTKHLDLIEMVNPVSLEARDVGHIMALLMRFM